MSDNYAGLDSTAQTKVAPATDPEITDCTDFYGEKESVEESPTTGRIERQQFRDPLFQIPDPGFHVPDRGLQVEICSRCSR